MKVKRQRQRQPTAPVTATIEKFSHDGRGITRIDGKTTFVDGALPQEEVIFQYLRQKSDFAEGKVLSVLKPSPHRVKPRCEHYDLCGGCSLQHLQVELQIQEKQALLLELLARIGHVEPEQILPPLTAKYWHYRNKARLSVRYVEKKQKTLIGFREKNNPRYITEIKNCSILNARVDAQIVNLRQLLDSFTNPQCIAQIEVAAGDDEVALIFRNLQSLSTTDEEKLRQFAQAANFQIYLQPAGPDSVYLFYPQDAHDLLKYALPEEGVTFKFHPTDFTQVNAELNRKMVSLALSLLELNASDVILDLFCGLGNFSLPMAKHCDNVLGIEGSTTMVERALMNARLNQLENTEFRCANLEDETVLSDLKRFKFTKILLDPPRTGALAIVNNIHHINPERIVYVSCNPATLARDADVLVNHKGYRLIKAGVMDMFPHTAHVESIALFQKG
jgi:23S rRNA (uracil1939-C5)-methyltransferase